MNYRSGPCLHSNLEPSKARAMRIVPKSRVVGNLLRRVVTMPDRFPLAFGALSEGLPCIRHQPLFLSPGTRTASRPSSIRPLATHCRVQKTGPNSSCDAFSVLAMSPAPLPGRRHRAMPMPWPALPTRSCPTSRRGQAKSSARPAGADRSVTIGSFWQGAR